MNPFETVEFKTALQGAIVDAINKVGIRHFKRMSWFASNELTAKEMKQAA